MGISQTVKKIPGGLMVASLLLGAVINTFFGNVLWGVSDGTFTIYLWRSGAMPILVVFVFCNATTINFREVGATIYRDVAITAVEVGIGTIIRLICDILFEEKGFSGLSTLVIIGALASSNDGLHATLAGEYDDATGVDVVLIPSTNDGSFFTMIALRAADVAEIPVSILMGYIVPVIVECILNNLNENIRKFCEPGVTILIPFSVLPLGVGLNIMNLLKAGGLGILLGVACTLVTGLDGYLIYRLLCMEYPEVGGAIGTTVGGAAATPASVAAVDATFSAVAEAATAQVTAVIIVAAILYPIFISYLREVEMHKRGR